MSGSLVLKGEIDVAEKQIINKEVDQNFRQKC